MNIILFVSALIMALSLLTYSKWEAYRNLHVVESQFKNYMEKTERSAINQAAERWYGTVIVQSRGARNQSQARTQANSRLSFKPFIDQVAQTTMQREFPQLQYLAKKLIHVLYNKAPFYRQMAQENPAFVEQFLASLMVADAIPKEKKLKVAKDLNTLHLLNPVLDDLLYKVLKGAPDPSQNPPAVPIFQAEEDDEDPDAELAEEYRSPVGYTSLLDYITLQPATKIRVFLASKPLLTAIFDDPQTVQQVLLERQRLYQGVASGALQVKDASTQFEAAFLGRADSNLNKMVLDFTVSKTNPKNYE